jgi:predicted nucleic-acid-binding Zn-ribbon protein
MKKALQCPKCEGRVLWRIEKVREHGDQNSLKPLPAGVERRWWGSAALGGFETFICAGCGYTEWYAYGLETLKPDEKLGIQRIDNRPEAGLR